MAHDAARGTAGNTLPSAGDVEVALDALESLTSADPRGALESATEVEHVAAVLGRTDLSMRAQLIRGYALDRLGSVGAGGRIAHDVNRWATEQGHRALMARSHLQLSWFYNMVGDTSAQLEHALLGLECLDEQSPARIRADHLQTLGGALITSGSHEEARNRFQRAEDIATESGELKLQIKVLNNRSYGEYRAGDAQEAMQTAERMLALAAAHDFELEITALDTVACAQMALGRFAEAEQTLLSAAERLIGSRGTNGDPEAQILLTLTETQRLQGATDRARVTLERCIAQCDHSGLAGMRVRALREEAELLALDGAYREAFEQYKVFHEESEALLSAERDARARTLQAVFEADEARRESLRFREMSMRDPLTGLYNRRFVDERLDSLLLETNATGAPLSVALVDLDYFKTVNDTLSHEVGDEVLKEVAGLLSAAVREPGFAARLGGEEFLLVLPEAGRPDAVGCCEAARQRIRSHAWADLIGDLTVTASIGVTTGVAGATARSELLANADRNLYAAKRAGRDRVVADPA